MLSVQIAVVLGILTVVGVALTGFGYDLADRILAWVGWLGGGAIGAGTGWFAVSFIAGPELPTKIGVAVAGLIGGAVLGRILIPVTTRLAMVVTGFLFSGGSTLLLFIGSDITHALATVQLSDPTTVAQSLEELAALPVFASKTFTQTLVIAGIVGVFGATVAVRFYTVVLTAAVSSVGAVLLGIVTPLWQQAIAGELTLGVTSAQPMPIIVIGAFSLGIAFQYYRHGDQLDLPFSQSDDPL